MSQLLRNPRLDLTVQDPRVHLILCKLVRCPRLDLVQSKLRRLSKHGRKGVSQSPHQFRRKRCLLKLSKTQRKK
jgi:hypothetical protein